MLRAAHGRTGLSAVLAGAELPVPHRVPVRPRVARRSPVIVFPPPRTIAVRGHVPSGSAAALILESSALCVVYADRSRRRRSRRFAIDEVMAVEERRHNGSSELVLLTTTSTIYVGDVDVAQAWAFCRELRGLILGSGR